MARAWPVGRWTALVVGLSAALASAALAAPPASPGGKSLAATPADLIVPAMTDEAPGPGKRVRQVHPEFRGTEVHHALHLPSDWRPERKWPVLVEYAGNQYKTSLGTVEGSNLGYGLSAGKGLIWLCMPYVDPVQKTNVSKWWGDVRATVDYCKLTVRRVCEAYGGDPTRVFVAGFSRGAIACNYIGLHDDEIARLWRGFICHSHYDGVRQWSYPASDRKSAAERLARLNGRPQFISHELSVEETRSYLRQACPTGRFRFMSLPFPEHTDTWTLHDIPEREALRRWFREVLGETGSPVKP